MTVNAKRRRFIQAVSATGFTLAGGVGAAAHAVESSKNDPWKDAQAIIDSFAKPLVFRKEDFPITAFGAASCEVVPATAWISFVEQVAVKTPAPGSKDCCPAIDAAIKACNKAGGGRVLIPAGNWYVCGPIVLLSNVNVHLAAGAHVYFSNNPLDYAKYGNFDCGKNGKLSITRWEGNDCLNYSSMVYAYNQTNIALTGDDWTSSIDGQAGLAFAGGNGDCFWSWKGRERPNTGGDIAAGNGEYIKHHKGQTEVSVNVSNPTALRDIAPHLTEEQARHIQGEGDKWRCDAAFLRVMAEAGLPLEKRIMGVGHYLRPHMVQFISCTNVLFQGYQLNNAPFWQHNPVNCHNMHANKIFANSMGPNSDGFDPESCSNVLIENSQFNTGDDCIAIDSGKGPDIQFGPSQNIVIQHCKMQSGHGAVTLGSIMSGGIRNIYAQDLVFENANWKTDPLNIAIRLKTNMSRGGFLHNLHVRNVHIPNGIRTTPAYYSSLPGSPIPTKSVASSAGGIITIDCDYDPTGDTVRTRPPVVSGVHISNVTVGTAPGGKYSCFQAIVVLGPVAYDYNGPAPTPAVLPVSDVNISDCDLGTPANGDKPIYLYNAKGITLKNVKIGGKIFNTTLAS
jgi:polygalacturonase